MRRWMILFWLMGSGTCILTAAIGTVDSELQRVKETYRRLFLHAPEQSDTLQADFVRIPPETELSDQVVVELHQRYPVDRQKVEACLAAQRADGSWPDIDYADTKRLGWEPKQHAERVLELARVYRTPGSEWKDSEQVRQALHRAMNYWFTRRPRCLNWWYNEIGVPKTLGAAFLLLEEELTDEERQAAIDVMKAARFRMTGQNKVWLAGNVLVRALLQDDRELVQAARDTIASEICLGRTEGIQPDWSFHQHGPQQQFGNYGLSYLSGMAFYARLFHDTSFAFSLPQQNILHALVDEGYRWVVWQRHMDVSALGRQFFHHAQLHKAYGVAFAAADLGLDGFPKQGNPLVGHKHFGCSDYTVHRCPDWMATVKMSSSRVIGTELVNEDNLKGYYMGDGATFFYRRGDEYLDVFPFWDWRKVPGVTAYEDRAPMPVMRSARQNNRSGNVGGLGDGRQGMTAMELDRDGLKGVKAWLFAEKFVVCLGAAVRSDSGCLSTAAGRDGGEGISSVGAGSVLRGAGGRGMVRPSFGGISGGLSVGRG